MVCFLRFECMKILDHALAVAPRALFLAALVALPQAYANPREDTLQAEASLRGGDVPTAMALLRKASDQGHPAAQARLADLLHAAEFDKEAVALYRKAAEQGDPAGEFGLGRMYANGTGVARDTALALDWYRKAEKQNHAPALDALARAHRAGDLGLVRNLEQAEAFETRARSARQALLKDSK